MHTFNLNPASAAVAAVALLSALPTAQASLYLKSSPVLQVDAKNFDRLINKSNHTSVIEFYAPWCGHCQNLKPAYEKAAKNLEGLAKVAAVNCDEDENKQLCGSMGVKGFPTLKTVRPGKGKKPVVEDYQGARTAKAIVDAVVDKINNHVKKVTDKDIDSFVEKDKDKPKAILFSEKGTTSALLKSIAIDFLDVISVAQIRSKESSAVEKYGISSYPTLILLPGGDQEHLVYDGEMKKDSMVKFLAQARDPNPDPAPTKSKSDKKDKKAQKSSDTTSSADAEAETESPIVPPPPPPTASEPTVAEVVPPIPAITSADKLTNECLNRKSRVCVLAFVPSSHGETAEKALGSLSEIAFKHARASRHLFPLFEVHTDNEATASVSQGLGLSSEVEVIAVNAKRGWWRHYEGDFGFESVESWIDAIRMNEGAKNTIPEGLVGKAVIEEEKVPAAAETVEVVSEETVHVEIETDTEEPAYSGADPTPEATDAPSEHDEL